MRALPFVVALIALTATWVPYMLIIGDNEEEAGTISVRDRKEREEKDVDLDAFREHLEREVDQKRTAVTFLA